MKKNVLILILLLFFAVSAQAQENVADTVIVTASRIAQSEKTSPQDVTIIGSEVLDKNQYEDLSGLLQNYGFQIMSYGPSQTSTQITMRGMSSDYSNPLDSNVLVLVNGAPIATTNLAMLPTDGIERIEILRGPAAAQYGSSAMGGVINIIPKTGGEKFHLSAEAGGGTWNAYRALGSLSGKKSVFDFAGAVSWNTQTDNYTTGDGKLYDDTSAAGRFKYLLNFGINFNDDNRLGIIALGAKDSQLGLNNSLYYKDKYNGLDTKADRINSAVDINYKGGYDAFSWNFKYYNAYDQYDIKYGDYNPLHYTDYNIDTMQSGGQGQISWNWRFLTVMAGMDYTTSEYSSGFNPRYQQSDTAGFGLIKLSFLDEMITISGGLRYDYYTFKVDGNEQDMDNTSLNVGIAINPWDWLTVRASYGESFKVPSGIAVVGYSGPYGVIGNPDLNPERGYGWDAGFDIHWKGIKVNLDYFSTLYTDKITSTYLSDGRSKYYNAGGVSYYNGIEGQLAFDLGEFFDWEFTLAPYFNFTKMFNFNDQEGVKQYNIRDFTGSFGVNFNHPAWGTDVDLRLNYLGYQKEICWEGDRNIGEKWTGNKTTVDLFISQTIYDFGDGGKLSLRGEGRNLTNENYAYRYDYPMPGRSFYLGVRYDF